MTNLILHVEDEENDAFLMQHAFNKAGVTAPVHVATDGQQALDYLKGEGKFSNRAEFPFPSLVLLDLKLPYVPGLDVVKFIRDTGLSVIVVILSSSESEADIAAAYRLGANAYLVKPGDTSKLLDIAKGIQQFWLTLNHAPPQPAAGHAALTAALSAVCPSLTPNPGKSTRVT